jgi:hypothetical protein
MRKRIRWKREKKVNVSKVTREVSFLSTLLLTSIGATRVLDTAPAVPPAMRSLKNLQVME